MPRRPPSIAELWRPRGTTLVAALRTAVVGFKRERLDANSAQFAYYALLCIVPLLILLLAALSLLPLEGMLKSFLDAAGRALPAVADEVVVGQLREIEGRTSPSLVIAAAVVFAFAGSRLFRTVTRGLNAAFEVREERRFWVVWGLALLVTVGAFVLLLLALALMLVGPLLGDFVIEGLHAPLLGVLLSRTARWIVVCGAVLLATSVIYWLAPSAATRWAPHSPGCVVATLGWIVVSLGFRFYVERVSRINETYGALGGMIVLLMWLYFTGSAILFGGMLNGVLYRAAQGEAGPEREE